MNIVLTGGGTAGHIYPAINVGLYMREHYGTTLSYVGRKHSMEERIASENGIDFYPTDAKGLSKKHLLQFATKNAKGVLEALALFKKIKPDYVFATGGFVSAPSIAAAKLLGIPYSIHEQNAVTGKVNRMFARGAKTVFHSFPVVETPRVRYSGNPVRYHEKMEKSGDQVLFTGGSGGSSAINAAALAFSRNHPEIPCLLVSGENKYRSLLAEKVPENLTILPFVTDMMALYRKARVVVSRSGSGTLFELANVTLPPVLIPFPQSAEDHQRKNAAYFEKKGAAVVIQEGKGFQELLERELTTLYVDHARLEEMKRCLDALSCRNSASVIAESIRQMVGGGARYKKSGE